MVCFGFSSITIISSKILEMPTNFSSIATDAVMFGVPLVMLEFDRYFLLGVPIYVTYLGAIASEDICTFIVPSVIIWSCYGSRYYLTFYQTCDTDKIFYTLIYGLSIAVCLFIMVKENKTAKEKDL